MQRAKHPLLGVDDLEEPLVPAWTCCVVGYPIDEATDGPFLHDRFVTLRRDLGGHGEQRRSPRRQAACDPVEETGSFGTGEMPEHVGPR